MQSQLDIVARSYDRAIELGKRGIDSYRDLPERITGDPEYPLFHKAELEGAGSGSSREEIRKYLAPEEGMHFIDLGCCVNLMFRGYDLWPSTYHGVDISEKTIRLLCDYVSEKDLRVGSLHRSSIHETPYDANAFDIGACIGVLEYFEGDFARKAVAEAHRIIRPMGRLVLDIPNIGNPMCRVMMLIEEHLGRPERFDMQCEEFEEILIGHFAIEGKEIVEAGAMIQYFLRCAKA